MEFRLKRTWKTDKSVIGLLYLYDEDGETIFRCYTLEDIERMEKVKGETAIPKGRYKMQRTFSPKFGREVWMLADVPNFSRVYIHAGNIADDTEGCILCGFIRRENKIERSREAVAIVYELIENAVARDEPVYIRIE